MYRCLIGSCVLLALTGCAAKEHKTLKDKALKWSCQQTLKESEE